VQTQSIGTIVVNYFLIRPEFIQSGFKCVSRFCIHNVIRQTIPHTDNSISNSVLLEQCEAAEGRSLPFPTASCRPIQVPAWSCYGFYYRFLFALLVVVVLFPTKSEIIHSFILYFRHVAHKKVERTDIYNR